MNPSWSRRLWDLAMLLAVAAAAVLVIQYSLARGRVKPALNHPVDIVVRVPRPLPDIAAAAAAGDPILDTRGRAAGEIIATQLVPSLAAPAPGQFSGERDLLLTARVSGELVLIRGGSIGQIPSGLKAGAWCLVSTPRVELTGQIVSVKVQDPASRP